MTLNEPQITVHGHLTADPELRFFESGTAVTELTVAQNPRYRDSSGTWRDGETVFLRVKAHRELAEVAANDLRKGHRVTVVGRLRRRTWADKDSGSKRWLDEIEADDIAVSLRGQHIKVAKIIRDSNGDEAAPARQ